MSIWKKKWVRVLAIVLAVVLVTVGACAVYLGDYYRADMQMVEYFATPPGTTREVWEDGTVAFVPQNPKTGLIFYPGGKVEHTAYEPLMKWLARSGVLCVLVQMPFRLAVLDMNAADGIQEKFPQIEHWYIGGHSLGGSMAASYLDKHRDAFDGLVLLGAYSTADLSDSELSVLSVYGSEDGVMNREKYEECLSNMPADFTEYVVDGGNHAYFGAYGEQKGDGIALVSHETQILQSALYIGEFLEGWRWENSDGKGRWWNVYGAEAHSRVIKDPVLSPQ